jgi:ComF family protein
MAPPALPTRRAQQSPAPELLLGRALGLFALLWRGFLASLLELIAPRRCSACDEPVAGRAAFCPVCASAVLRVGHPGGAPNAPRPTPGELCALRQAGIELVAYGYYGGPLGEAPRGVKYQDRPELTEPMADLARSAVRSAGLGSAAQRIDLVVPVPLHRARLAERGYNQSALIARPIARELGARFAASALTRSRATAPQAKLDRAARLTNVAQAFVAHRHARLKGRSVLLVDDVATTGATLVDCARALRQAGANPIRALVVAVSPADSAPL